MVENLTEHLDKVGRYVREGTLVPFLGAGVNLTDRSPADRFVPRAALPSGRELATYLADQFGYTASDQTDLSRISQYVSVMEGSGELYLSLHDLFDADYAPTSLHRLLARLPGIVRGQERSSYPLILTTNYDDSLERAFTEADEEIDLVSYIAEGPNRGKFLHRDPSGREQVVHIPNQYEALSPERRTVIVKIHGAVDRGNPDNDSYVITEDHYIDYLTRTDISNLLPVKLSVKLARSHFLFLGYSLTDWNLRVILHRIWGSQQLKFTSWAVQLDPEPIDQESWAQRGVRILDVPLSRYVESLQRVLEANGGGP